MDNKTVAPPGPLPPFTVIPGASPDEYVMIVGGWALIAPTIAIVDFPDGVRVTVLFVREGHEEADTALLRGRLKEPFNTPLGGEGDDVR